MYAASVIKAIQIVSLPPFRARFLKYLALNQMVTSNGPNTNATNNKTSNSIIGINIKSLVALTSHIGLIKCNQP
ncbi:hypothetical protein WCO01_01220 [Weissella confusa]|nr:hypothetical protein WCO01_01220 [Weissella confusa]